MERWSSVRAVSALVVALLALSAVGTEARAASPDLEVVLLDEQRAPVFGAQVLLERMQSGVWQPTSTEPLRTGTGGQATVAVPVAGPASYRLRIERWGTPTFAHRFDVASDGHRSHFPSEHAAAIEAGRVVLALTREDPWPGLHDPAWLVRVNEARAAAELGPLTQRQDWNVAARQHAAYVLTNQQRGGHYEDPALPGHTLAGEWATSTGNLIWGGGVRSSLQAVQLWLNSPGHAAWILHPGAREVGYAHAFAPDADADGVRFSSVMPITQGVDRSIDPGTSVTYPAAGAVLEVGEQPGGRCDQGWSQTHVNATCALHLRRDDLRELPASARFDAVVWVDGRSVTATVDAEPQRRRLSVLLAEPLPTNVEVRVRVDVDGAAYEGWRFTTRSRPLPHDIPRGSVHEAAIEAVVITGIARGYPDGSYRPRATVTRGHMASLLAAALRLPPGPTDGFRDFRGSAHDTAIGALAQAGIAAGYADGTFRPELPVSRGQIATMLAVGLDLDEQPMTLPHDVDGSVHARGIGALLQAEIMIGYRDGRFAPDQHVDRAQLASLLARAFGLLPA